VLSEAKLKTKIKRHIKITAVTLTFLMLFTVVFTVVSLLTDTTALAYVTQGQINRLREEKKEYERQKSEVQAKIDAYEFEHLTEMAKKEVLDQRIILTSLEIANINEIINQYMLLIREKEYEVYLAQNREEDQLQKFRNRVRDMEENGIISYLEIIFDSTGFSDLLARIDFVTDIMRADENTYTNLQNARQETEDAKADLEDTKAELDEEKVKLELKEIELLEQLEEAHELIRQLEENIENQSQLRDDIIAEEERVQREINEAVETLRRQQEAERLRRIREREAQSGGGGSSDGGGGGGGWVNGTGAFMWPTSGTVSSGYGPRSSGNHQGIDILAPHGANVYAADSGTVITSTYGGGYGNYVVISHGNGTTTLYAHLSSRSVNVGSSVSKGQVIGLVGSTGRSTAPHVHFEVTVNGSRVDPMTQL